MSSARLQDTKLKYKNQLYFCIFAMNNPKIKWKIQIHYIIVKENKILSYTRKVKVLYTEDYKILFKEII